MALAGDELMFTFVSPGEIEQWTRERSLAGRMPQFFVDEQRIGVELAGTRVRALIVLADGTEDPANARWRDQMPCTVRIALDELARMLARCHHRAGCAAPLIDLDLAYRPDNDYHERRDCAHENMHPYIAPVRPIFFLRWRSATTGQRKAFLDELPNGGSGRSWLRRRRTVRIMGLELEIAP